MKHEAERGRVFPSPEVVEAIQLGVKRRGVAGLVKAVEGLSWSPVMAAGFGCSLRPEHLLTLERRLRFLKLLGDDDDCVMCGKYPCDEHRGETGL